MSEGRRPRSKVAEKIQENCDEGLRYEALAADATDESRQAKLYAKAAGFFSKAAEQGHADAQCHFATMLAEGRGTKQDMSLAMIMFRKAAAQGHEGAERYLKIFGQDLSSRMGHVYMEGVAREAREFAGEIIKPRESLMVGLEPVALVGEERDTLLAHSAELSSMAAGIEARSKSSGAQKASVLGERGIRETTHTHTHTCLWGRALGLAKGVDEDHPDYAAILNNEAIQSFAKGRHQEAQSKYTEALAVRRNCLDADDPFIGASLNNLAGLSEAMGRPDVAEPLYEGANQIYSKSLPPMDATADMSRYSMAELYRSTGRYDEARDCIRESLKVDGTMSPCRWRDSIMLRCT